MIYLCCDTNIWINISNGYEPPRLLDRLYDEVRDGNIKLLLPEVIRQEWERNKKKFIIDKTSESTKKQIEGLRNLNEFLERDEFEISFLWDDELDTDENEKVRKLREKIDELQEELKTHKEEIVGRARKNLEKVEEIFNHPNTIVLNTDEKTSLFVMKLAIEKKFPFENEKNNFADCLIFYQFVNYLKEHSLEKGHFVTSNRTEFFPKNKLHDSLQKEIDSLNSFFYKSLSEALNNTLNEELVNLKELKRVEDLYELDWDEYSCVQCSSEDEYSALYFNHKIEVRDGRSEPIKNQFLLEFGDDAIPIVDEEEEDEVIEETEIAFCNSCGEEYIKCPVCGEIWNFVEYDKNKIQYCQGCAVRFKYVEELDRKGMVDDNYVELSDDTDVCGKCGQEYDASETGIDICEACNEEYINK